MIHTKAVLLALMLLSAFCQAVPAGGYVALGDGYSSGIGIDSYDATSGSCHRSSLAFPALWVQAQAQKPKYFRFAACNGASIEDVTTRQLAQVSADTAIISLTIGVDDVGLDATLRDCTIKSMAVCQAQAQRATNTIREELPGRLDALYKAIRTKAPEAKVVVLGYPMFFSQSRSAPCQAFSAEKQSIINDIFNVLNTVVQEQATSFGFIFGDMYSTFAGHELCSTESWINGRLLRSQTKSFSVNGSGHKNGYLSVFSGKLSS